MKQLVSNSGTGVDPRNYRRVPRWPSSLLAALLCASIFGPPVHAKADPPTNETNKPARLDETAGNTNETASAQNEAGWKSLFDGRTLYGWKSTDFAGHGEVKIEKGQILLEMGSDMTGVTWTNPVVKMNYEVSLDAMRVDGSDFFCGLTFPVSNSPCSLIVGGWGGGVVGLSSLDGQDASENETTRYMSFENGRWYHIRLRVTPAKIEAWIDKKKVVDVSTAGHRISIRYEVELSRPFGISSWCTTAALKNIKLRRLD
ncbi:MAG: DUF1080 domain-containing protein [Candidatus Omnitrophica bacterium]|nr:DUF1080 domain-containing protein [Candidatus Omnitrophota bacterium]